VGSVHQGPVIRKGNELDVARADLTRALRRVARATAGEDASFAQLEDAALEAADEAVRDFCEQELQRIEDSFDDELLINGVLFKRSHAPAQGDYRSLCGSIPSEPSIDWSAFATDRPSSPWNLPLASSRGPRRRWLTASP